MSLLDRWKLGWGIVARVILFAIAVSVLLAPLYLLHRLGRPDHSDVVGFGLLYLLLVFPCLLPGALETCGLKSDLIGSLSEEEYHRRSSPSGRSGGTKES